MRSYSIEYSKKRLVFPALRTVVRGFVITLVPATFVVSGRIVMCFAIVCAIIASFAQPLWKEYISRCIVRNRMNIHSVSA